MKRKKITPEQVKLLKENIDKLSKSDEQFIFILFKNENGTDNITEYSYNLPQEKLAYYFRNSINHGEIVET
jgi:hypothetical protein